MGEKKNNITPDNLRMKVKADKLKQARAGKTKTIAVNVSDDPNLNFQHMIDEVMELAELHKLKPGEFYAMANHFKWTAINIQMQTKINFVLFREKQKKTFEDKRKEQLEKEKAEGKVRVKPEVPVDTGTGKEIKPVEKKEKDK